MVDPSITEADRERFLKRLRIGFSLLVGGSMALAGLYGDARLPVVVVALVGGTLAGAALAWWVIPDGIAASPYERRRR